METLNLKEMCAKHENKTKDILCLDDNHKGSSICCIQCIMDDHKECQIEKIFIFKEIKRNIILDDKKHKFCYIKNELLQLIKDSRVSCDSHYSKKLKNNQKEREHAHRQYD